eukprot:COSAG06_NODE_3950_length_4738_cov_3.813823_1_plen_79_part_00
MLHSCQLHTPRFKSSPKQCYLVRPQYLRWVWLLGRCTLRPGRSVGVGAGTAPAQPGYLKTVGGGAQVQWLDDKTEATR